MGKKELPPQQTAQMEIRVSPADVRMLAERRIDDSSARLRFQHEFALAGFKTLVLINGGAIIALLTYAGNKGGAAGGFGGAFIAYAAGLIASVLAYLVAYNSQSQLMNADMVEAYRLLGIPAQPSKSREFYERWGMAWVYAGIAFSILALAGFVTGSWVAMKAIS